MEVVTLAWLFWTSFKRNWLRYRLALIGLAAAVAVACVGISGSAVTLTIIVVSQEVVYDSLAPVKNSLC